MTVKELKNVRSDNKKTVLAVGNFDGVHTGHAALLKRTAEIAEETGAVPGVWSFENYTPRSHGVSIILPEDRGEIFADFGIERMFLCDYGEICDTDPETFVKEILIDRCHAVCAVCGYNFRFGKNASGDADDLKKYMEKYGGSCECVPAVTYMGETVSSTAIRGYLSQGEPERAAAMLGRPFYIKLPVVHGRELGRKLGFPTINQVFPPDLIVPRHGAYACIAEIDGKKYKAASNVGIRPTVDGAGINSETHIIGYDGDLYNCVIKVEFVEFLRPERRFSSLEELKKQIAEDVKKAKETVIPE